MDVSILRALQVSGGCDGCRWSMIRPRMKLNINGPLLSSTLTHAICV